MNKYIFLLLFLLLALASCATSVNLCVSQDIADGRCVDTAWKFYSDKLDSYKTRFEANTDIKIVNMYSAIPFDKYIDRQTIRDEGLKLNKEAASLGLWQAVKYENGSRKGTLFQLDLGGHTEGEPWKEVFLSKSNVFAHEKICPVDLEKFTGECYRELQYGWLLIIHVR